MAEFDEAYARELRFLEELNSFRAAWAGFKPSLNMKYSDLFLLGTIYRLGLPDMSVTVGQLAKEMQQSPPAISQKLNALQQQGYLRRVAEGADKRRVQVQLTPYGREITRRASAEFFERMQKVFNEMGPKKADGLIKLMTEFCVSIQTIQEQERDSIQ